jgi:uncharacterized protein YbcV (DUF1398 family)
MADQRIVVTALDLLGQAQVLFDHFEKHLAGKGLARYKLPVSSPSPSEPLVRFSLKRLTR